MGKSINNMQVGVVWGASSIVSLSLNGTLNIINPDNLEEYTSVSGHHAPIHTVVCDKKNKKFYSCGSDETLIEWELGSSKTRFIEGESPKGIINTIALVGDHIYSGHADGTIKITAVKDFTFDKEKQKVDGFPLDMAVSHDEKLVLVLTAKGLTTFVNNKLVKFYDVKGEPQSFSINPSDKTQIVVGGKDKKLRILSLVDDNLKEVKVIDNVQAATMTKVRFAPCGNLLACSDSQKTIKVFDTSDWSVKHEYLHYSAVSDIDWTSDSKYLLSASLDKDAIVWDLANKKELKVQAHFQGLKCISLMDDNTFITASEDFCLKSWSFNN